MEDRFYSCIKKSDGEQNDLPFKFSYGMHFSWLGESSMKSRPSNPQLFFWACIFLTPFSAHSAGQQKWRWYLSTFCAPTLDSSLCNRVGTAQVQIDKDRVLATLIDPQIPESPLVFKGTAEKQKMVKGWLRGLSTHEPAQDKFEGAYSAMKMGSGCKAEQILLMPKVPDGTVLSLSRVQGSCQ